MVCCKGEDCGCFKLIKIVDCVDNLACFINYVIKIGFYPTSINHFGLLHATALCLLGTALHSHFGMGLNKQDKGSPKTYLDWSLPAWCYYIAFVNYVTFVKECCRCQGLYFKSLAIKSLGDHNLYRMANLIFLIIWIHNYIISDGIHYDQN